MTDTTFNLNLADDLGGALLVDDPVTTSSSTPSGLSFTNNSADYGGAVSLLYVDSVMSASTLEDNYAGTGGGAFHIFFSGTFAGDLLTVEGNDAGSVGGALFAGSGESTDPVTSTIIEGSSFVDEQLWIIRWWFGLS